MASEEVETGGKSSMDGEDRGKRHTRERVSDSHDGRSGRRWLRGGSVERGGRRERKEKAGRGKDWMMKR